MIRPPDLAHSSIVFLNIGHYHWTGPVCAGLHLLKLTLHRNTSYNLYYSYSAFLPYYTTRLASGARLSGHPEASLAHVTPHTFQDVEQHLFCTTLLQLTPHRRRHRPHTRSTTKRPPHRENVCLNTTPHYLAHLVRASRFSLSRRLYYSLFLTYYTTVHYIIPRCIVLPSLA